MRLLACIVAAVVYVWQEQREYSFSQVHFAAFIFGVCVLSLSLFSVPRVARAASKRQNPWPAPCTSLAGALWKSMPSSLPAPNSL